MKTYSAEEINARLRNKTGFFRGILLSLKLGGKFLLSLGPQNWNIVKLTNAGRIDPLEGGTRQSATEVTVAHINPDRKAP